MIDAHGLDNHAAQGRTADMRSVDAQFREKGDAVCGHVVERIGNIRRETVDHFGSQFCHVGYTFFVEMTGKADIPVVETDHVKVQVSQRLAEVRIPGDHLAAKTHDQQECRVRRIAE